MQIRKARRIIDGGIFWSITVSCGDRSCSVGSSNTTQANLEAIGIIRRYERDRQDTEAETKIYEEEREYANQRAIKRINSLKDK